MNMSGCRFPLVLSVLLLLTAGSPALLAKPLSPQKQAERLSQEGLALFRERQFPEAVSRFAAAYALDPYWRYLWNQARAQEEGGQAEEAAASYRELMRHPKVPLKDKFKASERLAGLQLTPQRQTGDLEIACLPEAAAFELRGPEGTVQGRCPWKQEGLVVGSYQVRVEAPGYMPESRAILLVAGQLTSEQVRLSPLPGRLLITATQPGGQVTVGGVAVGTTPQVEVELPAGEHEVQVIYPWGVQVAQRIDLPPGGRLSWQADPPPVAPAPVPLQPSSWPAPAAPAPVAASLPSPPPDGEPASSAPGGEPTALLPPPLPPAGTPAATALLPEQADGHMPTVTPPSSRPSPDEDLRQLRRERSSKKAWGTFWVITGLLVGGGAGVAYYLALQEHEASLEHHEAYEWNRSFTNDVIQADWDRVVATDERYRYLMYGTYGAIGLSALLVGVGITQFAIMPSEDELSKISFFPSIVWDGGMQGLSCTGRF
ncbi:MAG: PEGA domain-containing protein [Myxococcota bacterium]|jgi:hypothetical protein|nr:PEGA domain-containing protein [Myxococcota bacterium]